jgi:hypothetical protein
MVWFPEPPVINTPPLRWNEPRQRIYPTGRMPVTGAPVYAPGMPVLPLGAALTQSRRSPAPARAAPPQTAAPAPPAVPPQVEAPARRPARPLLRPRQ